MRIPYTLLVVAALLIPAMAQSQTRLVSQIPSSVVEMTRMEQDIISQINIIRMRNKLRPLRQNEVLARAAQKHSRNMATRNFFDHNDPQGRDVGDRTKAERYNWQSVGENIAMNAGYPNPTKVAVEGWMKSQGHKENILRPHYTETGVGVTKIGSRYYFTQVFGRPLRGAEDDDS